MAKIIRRVWTGPGPTGKRVRHVAYGYTLMVNGSRERKVSSEWLAEADAVRSLSQRLKEVEAGQISERRDLMLGQAIQEHLERKRREGKRSIKDDERILTKCVLPAFGPDQRLRALTREMIARYRERRLVEVSPYTVSNELAVLRHLLRCAHEIGDLDAVPVIKLPKKPDGRLRYLEEDEIARLLTACRDSRNRCLFPVVVLALNTGMRKGEILGLEWERIDLSSGRITLVRTKSGKPRGIPMNDAVYAALVELEPDAGRRTGRLFPNGNDRRGSQIRVAFDFALKRAGIADCRFHDLRHTAASHLVMKGAALREVQEILGHSDLRMTLRYAHLSPAHLRGAVQRLQFGVPLGVPEPARNGSGLAHGMAHGRLSTLPVAVSP